MDRIADILHKPVVPVVIIGPAENDVFLHCSKNANVSEEKNDATISKQ